MMMIMLMIIITSLLGETKKMRCSSSTTLSTCTTSSRKVDHPLVLVHQWSTTTIDGGACTTRPRVEAYIVAVLLLMKPSMRVTNSLLLKEKGACHGLIEPAARRDEPQRHDRQHDRQKLHRTNLSSMRLYRHHHHHHHYRSGHSNTNNY